MFCTYGQPVPRSELLTTAQAAREIGISARTLARYAERGLLSPAVVLPSGHRRWDMADVRRQLAALRERDE